MGEKTVQARYLTTPAQRAVGAMFKKNLGDTALVFVYPHPAPRIFHTFFCPPLRVIAVDPEGEILFDQLIARGRFVRLPATCLVIETDPDLAFNPEDLQRLVRAAPQSLAAVGAWQVDTSLDRLLFALLKEAVADIRRVYEAHGRATRVSADVLRTKFPPWERGQLTSSAGFILDLSGICEVPETAVKLSHQILKVEDRSLDEISAASLAGTPWKRDFPDRCLRCDRPGSWRKVLGPAPTLDAEAAWRYGRPENHVLLCRRCAAWLGWQGREVLRLDLAGGLWGARFDAFRAWHQAVSGRRLPAWDLETHPLWPKEFGGRTWETGSGARRHVEPRTPAGVHRNETHRAAVARVLAGRGGIRRKRRPGQPAPWQGFMQLAEISASELF